MVQLNGELQYGIDTGGVYRPEYIAIDIAIQLQADNAVGYTLNLMKTKRTEWFQDYQGDKKVQKLDDVWNSNMMINLLCNILVDRQAQNMAPK